MYAWKTIASALLTLLLLAACGRITPLAPTFTPGDKTAYKLMIDTYDDMRVRGQYQTKYESHQIFEFEQQVLEPFAGNPRLQVVFKRISLQTDLAGGKIIRFDSSEDSTGSSAYFRPLLAMLNRPLTLTFDAMGKLQNVEGFEAILAAVQADLPAGEVGPEMLGTFQSHYGPAFLANMYEPFFGSLPPSGKREATTWQRQRTLSNPFLGELTFNQNCNLADAKARIAQINYEGTIYPDDQSDTQTQVLPRTGATLSLRNGKVTGELTVDRGDNRLNGLKQETVLFLGLGKERNAEAGQRMTTKMFIERR